MVSIFQLGYLRKLASPVPFGVRSEIHTIVNYDRETHFDVDKKNMHNRFGGNQSF